MSAVATVAIVGGFQRGKSTFVNALLGQDVAEMGRGLSTTHENRTYSLSQGLYVIDTPGFNANGKDDGTASEAIGMADVVACVQESKAIGSSCDEIFELVRKQGKRVVFLLNCCKFAKWSPEENGEIIATIEAELKTKRIFPSVIPIAGKPVLPINVLWARFGLGQTIDQDDYERVLFYANRRLRLPAEIDDVALRAEMLQRSGFLPVRDFLKNLPLEILKHVAVNPKREIERVVDRFAEELKKRWAAA